MFKSAEKLSGSTVTCTELHRRPLSRVTAFLEKLEMSGNLIAVNEMLGNFSKVGGKKIARENC